MNDRWKWLVVLLCMVALVGMVQASTTFTIWGSNATGVMPNAKQSSDTIWHEYIYAGTTSYANPGVMNTSTAVHVEGKPAPALAEPGYAHYNFFGSYISDPLSTQTVSGTVTITLSSYESSGNVNMYPRIKIYKWLANDSYGSDLLFSTSGTESNGFGDNPVAYWSDAAITSTSFADGDRIVVELESYDSNTRTNTYTQSMRLGNGSTANPTYLFKLVFSSNISFSSAPVSSFTANQTSGASPLPVLFTDTSTNTPTSWNYTFNNKTGNNTEIGFSTSQNPTLSFGVGNFSIRLNASNSAGYNWSTQTTWINVSAPAVSPPVASFTTDKTTIRFPNLITCTDTSTNTPTSWQWSWGDGTANSTTQNPTHQYAKRGSYIINMAATNAGGTGIATAKTVKVIGYQDNYT